LSRHRKNRCAGPSKARGPRPWPIWPVRKSVPARRSLHGFIKTSYHGWLNMITSSQDPSVSALPRASQPQVHHCHHFMCISMKSKS